MFAPQRIHRLGVILKSCINKKLTSGQCMYMYAKIIFCFEGLILSTAESSKELRKFCLKTLRGLGFGKVDMEQRIQEEVSGLLQTIENNMNHSLDLTHVMQTSVSNIICSIVLGKLFAYNDPEFKEILKMKETIFQTCNNVVNFMPWLRFFPGDPFKFQLLLKTSLDLSAFLNDFVKKRIESKNDDSINDLTDALLIEMRERQALNQNLSFGSKYGLER